jgi:type IV secretory pathway TrbF-like protein
LTSASTCTAAPVALLTTLVMLVPAVVLAGCVRNCSAQATVVPAVAVTDPVGETKFVPPSALPVKACAVQFNADVHDAATLGADPFILIAADVPGPNPLM